MLSQIFRASEPDVAILANGVSSVALDKQHGFSYTSQVASFGSILILDEVIHELDELTVGFRDHFFER